MLTSLPTKQIPINRNQTQYRIYNTANKAGVLPSAPQLASLDVALRTEDLAVTALTSMAVQ